MTKARPLCPHTIAEDTGQPFERVFDDSLHDHWHTAEEALEYGFIDTIVQSFDDYKPQKRTLAGFRTEHDGSTR